MNGTDTSTPAFFAACSTAAEPPSPIGYRATSLDHGNHLVNAEDLVVRIRSVDVEANRAGKRDVTRR